MNQSLINSLAMSLVGLVALLSSVGCVKNSERSATKLMADPIFTNGSSSTDPTPTPGSTDTAPPKTVDKTSVDVKFFCSDDLASGGRAKLRTTTNAILIIYDASIEDMPVLERSSVKPLYKVYDSIENPDGFLAGLINEKKFRVPKLKIPDGEYTYVVCDREPCNYEFNIYELSQMTFGPLRFNVADGVWSLPNAFLPDGMPNENVGFVNMFLYASNSELYEETTPPYEPNTKCDESWSPLIIDLNNDGIALSAPLQGTRFDMNGDGRLDRISWPTSTDDRFLALDRNGNGNIDDVNELFGDNTVGPDGKKAFDGFEALRKYDSNNDHVIDSKDPIFKDLKLFADANRDGKVQAGELTSLADAKILEIQLPQNLYYKLEVDKYKNETRRRSIVKFLNGNLTRVVDIWFRPI